MIKKVLVLHPKSKPIYKPITLLDIDDAITDDINKFCNNFEGEIDRDRAIQIASDFYNNYPMLMEYVRSEDFIQRRK